MGEDQEPIERRTESWKDLEASGGRALQSAGVTNAKPFRQEQAQRFSSTARRPICYGIMSKNRRNEGREASGGGGVSKRE